MHIVKLNLGCGPKKIAGYLNVDIDPSIGPDLAATHLALPFASNTLDAIEVYHSIEHMYLWDAEAAIKEWYRVLKPGGQLVVECPDLRKSIEYILKHDDFGRYSQLGMWGVYGDPSHNSYFYGHHWGYTPGSLTGILLRVGFRNVVSEPPRTHKRNRDMRLEASKPLKKITPFQNVSKSDNTPRIFWMLLGPRSVASSRIHGYQLHDYLKKRGWTSSILVEPLTLIKDISLTVADCKETDLFRAGDVVVVQKLRGPRTAELLDWLAEVGVTTILLDSDMPLKLTEASVAMWTVCTSAFLALMYRKSGIQNTVYIPDAVEHFALPRMRGEGINLRCAWFGNLSPSKEGALERLRCLLAQPELKHIELITISNHPQADIRWELKTSFRHLRTCDFAVLPAKLDDESKAKSSNRALQAMALGLPVIASPIPAYQEVVHNGYNGFLCTTDAEWLSALKQMTIPETREKMARNAYEFAQEFSIEKIGAIWECFLGNITAIENIGKQTGSKAKMNLRVRQLRSRALLGLIGSTKSTSVQVHYFVRAVREWPFERMLMRVLPRFSYALVKAFLRRFLRQVHAQGS